MTTTEPSRTAAGLPRDGVRPGGRRGRRRSLTVRERILAVVLVLTGLTLTVAGGSAWVLQRDRVDDGIDASLRRTAQEFTTFARQGLDPATGEPFTEPRPLVFGGMLREVPAANEGMVGFVDGRLEFTAPGGLDLASDAELVREVTRRLSTSPDAGVIATLTTAETRYRYVVVPVVMDAGTGALVVAFDQRAEQQQVTDTFRTYALVCLAAFALLAVTGWVISGRLLRPVRELREATEQITDTDLSRRIDVRGNDDLSDLTRTVNAMLGRLEDAFVSQRRLLDDAGHELRTPITIVRGHLELMDPDDPQDAAATRELAVGELDRMHRLADDLVLLAKTQRPDFVHLGPTSVGMLTDNVLDLARPLGRRRWLVDQRLEATAELDAQRVTQAMLQLAANAVKFSEDGSTVAVGSALRDGALHLWVRDEGVGVAPEDRERIFERFARAPGAQRREGAGLGLAIVAAIARAHDGRVELDSRPGIGSIFTLVLPARGVVEPGDDGGPPDADGPPAAGPSAPAPRG